MGRARYHRSLESPREGQPLVGVSPDTIINWELRGVKLTLKRHRQRLAEFLGSEVYDG